MKKLIAVILTFVLLLTFVGCGGDDPQAEFNQAVVEQQNQQLAFNQAMVANMEALATKSAAIETQVLKLEAAREDTRGLKADIIALSGSLGGSISSLKSSLEQSDTRLLAEINDLKAKVSNLEKEIRELELEDVEYTHTATKSLVLRGDGSYINVQSVHGKDTHWAALASSSDSTYIQEAGNGEYRDDCFLLEKASIPYYARISSINVKIRVKEVKGEGWADCGLRLGSAEEVTGGWQLSSNFVTYTKEISRPGGGAWNTYDLNDLQVIVCLWSLSDIYTQCSRVWVEVKYRY